MLNIKNKTYRDYVNKEQPLLRNYLFSILAVLFGTANTCFMEWVPRKWVNTILQAGQFIWRLLSYSVHFGGLLPGNGAAWEEKR